MTLTEFKTLISAYGASPERWPEGRRADAAVFMRTHPSAAALLEPEARLDTALDMISPVEPSELLRARIMKAATGQTAESAPAVNTRRPWRAIAASLIAAVTIGIFGYSALFAPQADDPAEEAWLEAANDLGVSEIYAWVEGTDQPGTETEDNL